MYSTGHIDKKEIDQPKPTTGEMTKPKTALAFGPNDECVQIGGFSFTVNVSAQSVADAINDALAAEREVSNKISENARNLHIDNQQLRSQLAAANDRFDTLQRQAEELHGRAQRAEKQLATAQAAIKEIYHLSGNDSIRLMIQAKAICKVLVGDTAALDAVIAEARMAQAHDDKKHYIAAQQPLVDSLHRLAMRVLQSDFYLQAKDETDNALLLTKAEPRSTRVKEGK